MTDDSLAINVLAPIAIAKWAALKAKTMWEDDEGKLRGYFVQSKDGVPNLKLAQPVFVPPGTPAGYFENSTGSQFDAQIGWFAFGGPDAIKVWAVGEGEPDAVMTRRSEKAVAKVLQSSEELRTYITGVFEGAPGEASSVTNAAAVWHIIQNNKFLYGDELKTLFRVSIALHLHGGDIYDKAVANGGLEALALAIAESVPSGGRTLWIEGKGKAALEGQNRAAFVEWSQLFWTALAQVGAVSEAVVDKSFNHNKGYHQGISFAQESSFLTKDEGLTLVMRLTENRTKVDPITNLVAALSQMELLKENATYAKVLELYSRFEQSVTLVYDKGIDFSTPEAKKTLANLGIE